MNVFIYYTVIYLLVSVVWFLVCLIDVFWSTPHEFRKNRIFSHLKLYGFLSFVMLIKISLCLYEIYKNKM